MKQSRTSINKIGPSRLRILSALAETEALTFSDVVDMGFTYGNVSRLASGLERAGHITITRTFEGTRRCTTYTITSAGRAVLRAMVRQEAA